MLLGRAGKLVFWRHRVTEELVNVEVLDWVGYLDVIPPQPAANGPAYFGNIMHGKGHWQFNERYEWIQILTRR